jgi:arabinogalactan endo-1,4-beta-galactosidase
MVAALGACGAPLDYTGKRCDTERACPDGWVCGASGTCRRRGHPNTVTNGGFESGVSGWTVSGGTLEPVAAGKLGTGAQWKPGGASASVVTTVSPSVDAPTPSVWYCARAWVQGSDDAEVELAIFEGGAEVAAQPVAAQGNVWQRVKTANLSSGEPLSVALRSPPDAGARTLNVDELALWRDVDPACDEEP